MFRNNRLVFFFALWVLLLVPGPAFAHDVAVFPSFKPVIMVDPGHGGIDGGTYRGKLIEKNLVLDMGVRTDQALKKLGFIVIMTRDQDTDLSSRYPSSLQTRHKRDLQNRLTMIREIKPALFISIHVNSSTASRDKGPLVFYSADSDAGKELAIMIQSALNKVATSTQRPIGRKNLFLLRHSPCPAILVESGFITNPADAMRLADPAYREKIAVTIAHATLAYYRMAY